MPPKWKKRSKMITKDDYVMVDPQPTDIIIPIMGPTGSGKSTFVNLLLRKDGVEVGHDLESCTARLNPIIFGPGNWPNPSKDRRRLIIIDTPGFDDTYVDDSEILRRISVWLAASYSDSMKLAGVIFLQEITQMRMLGTTLRNTDVFKNLCGDNILKFVVLGTTKWELVTQSTGEAREQQLKEQYWKNMLDHDAQTLRIGNNSESAWNTIDAIIKKHDQYEEVMLIQKELVDLQKILPDTEAGKTLRASLQRALEKQQVRGPGASGAAGQNSQDDEDVKRILRQISALSVNVSRRLMTMFGGV